jgi:ParB-like chromosome segregation protein Spo0J
MSQENHSVTNSQKPTPGLSPIAALRPNAKNARTHSEAQIKKIADSIRAFGFLNPIVVARDGTVIAGHGRLEAAKQMIRHC